MSHPKKVGALPVAGREEAKQTNEIGMFIPLLDGLAIQGKDITADALLTQRKLAAYVVERNAHYHFTVKANQPTLQADIALAFQHRQAPDHVEVSPPDHGRIETRRIWCSSALNAYLDFPHVGQVFLIEREVLHKKSNKRTLEISLGVSSRTPGQARPMRILVVYRGHWTIENRCHYVIDWNYDEDRSRISKGYGPENISRLRRFTVGILHHFCDGNTSIAQKMSHLNRNIRLVFDYLRMTNNSTGHASS